MITHENLASVKSKKVGKNFSSMKKKVDKDQQIRNESINVVNVDRNCLLDSNIQLNLKQFEEDCVKYKEYMVTELNILEKSILNE